MSLMVCQFFIRRIDASSVIVTIDQVSLLKRVRYHHIPCKRVLYHHIRCKRECI